MARLSERDRLQLQQLRLLAWAEDRDRRDRRSNDVAATDDDRVQADRWRLISGLQLHAWQAGAVEAWFSAGRRGTIKVVTGAGKTILALAIAERLQHDDPDLRMAVVVPTIVLMNQWYDVLATHSNLPSRAVARLGGGEVGDFTGETRILLAVLATARKELPRLVQQAGVGRHLLLIADECHRVGAPEMSAVLNTERAYSLGLSATPEREDDAAPEAGTGRGSPIEAEIGPIVYEMTFAAAIREGVLPPFEIHHFGIPLSSQEAHQYATLSRSISDLRRQLTASSPAARQAGGGERLLAWARRVSSRGSSNLASAAAQYVNDTTRRKQLLYRAESRKEAALALVQGALAIRADARIILFHESINEVVSLFEMLTRNGLPAVMEHSELTSELRESTLELFRAGIAQVVVSARSLIEGFNVPEADLGIIVASSSSPRQRIQSIGRVLRRYQDSTGEQKTSRVCVLYVRDSVDEAIYEKEDWDRLLGLDRNRYFTWDPPAEPIEQPEAPRRAPPREDAIDFDRLRVGSPYPGRYEGVRVLHGQSGQRPRRRPAGALGTPGTSRRPWLNCEVGPGGSSSPQSDVPFSSSDGRTTTDGNRCSAAFWRSRSTSPPSRAPKARSTSRISAG